MARSRLADAGRELAACGVRRMVGSLAIHPTPALERAVVQLAATLKELLVELERERDVLRVKVHLGKAEARQLLSAIEEKLFQLRLQVTSMKDHAKQAARSAEARIHPLVDEVRELLARVQEIV